MSSPTDETINNNDVAPENHQLNPNTDLTFQETDADDINTKPIPSPHLRSEIQVHRSRPKMHMNSRLKLAMVLTIMLCICFTPIVVLVIVDRLTMNYKIEVAIFISSIPIYVYTTLCPIMLVVYLPSLKSAIVKLLTRIES